MNNYTHLPQTFHIINTAAPLTSTVEQQGNMEEESKEHRRKRKKYKWKESFDQSVSFDDTYISKVRD